MSQLYEIEFARLEPNKRYAPGFLITTVESGWMWLKDANKVTLRKGVVSAQIMSSICEAASIVAAGYDIRIIKAVDKTLSVTTAAPKKSNDVEKENSSIPSSVPPSSASDAEAHSTSSLPAPTATLETTDRDPAPPRPSLDQSLISSMRPHQVTAANFLLARLLGEDVNDEPAIPTTTRPPISSMRLLTTGAILADDMGTGKTLTAIAVMWALIRHGRAKGVVVCPSSLVGNWEKECNTWLPHSLGSRAAGLFATSKDAAHKVHLFCSTPSSVRPLLVISYDLFRNYIEQFNRVVCFDVLVCDEGHRLKNALGTKTTLALGNCIAMRRLVLTGTPVQNNLDELYSVVNFAVPGYLGSLAEFKSKYGSVMEAGGPVGTGKRRGHSTSASSPTRPSLFPRATLRTLLSRILLRRTKDTILRLLLPPRTDWLLFCGMTSPQKEEYLSRCDQVLDECTAGASMEYGDEKRRKVDDGTIDSTGMGGMDSTGMDDGVGPEADPLTLLPTLLQLRLTANSSSSSMAPSVSTPPESLNKDSSKLAAEFLLQQSGKMQVLHDLLLALWRGWSTLSTSTSSSSRPLREKVVIVSNFTSALDDVACLAIANGWHWLRIDGSVPAEKRLRQVNHFNTPDSPFFIMLLSAKAGGVGLNLTGGSRLVMLDPDWNPATDAQCMGRVWRDGQTRRVFIYRMLTQGSIDEVILARQVAKNELSSVIAVEGEEEAVQGTHGEVRADGVLAWGRIGHSLEDMVLPRGRGFIASTAHPCVPLSPKLASTSSTCVPITGTLEDAVLEAIESSCLLEVHRV